MVGEKEFVREMELKINKIINQSENIKKNHKNYLINAESDTKEKLVNPFFKMLGYCSESEDTMTQIKVKNGGKKEDSIDLAIKKNSKIIAIIEIKAVVVELDENHRLQLNRYYNDIKSSDKHIKEDRIFAILTNGLLYKFFYDIDEPNIMDKQPFLEFDLTKITNKFVDDIKFFKKSLFNPDELESIAIKLRYAEHIDNIKLKLKQEFDDPSDEFINYIFDDGLNTNIENRKIMLQIAFNSLLDDNNNNNSNESENEAAPTIEDVLIEVDSKELEETIGNENKMMIELIKNNILKLKDSVYIKKKKEQSYIYIGFIVEDGLVSHEDKLYSINQVVKETKGSNSIDAWTNLYVKREEEYITLNDLRGKHRMIELIEKDILKPKEDIYISIREEGYIRIGFIVKDGFINHEDKLCYINEVINKVGNKTKEKILVDAFKYSYVKREEKYITLNNLRGKYLKQ